ncbi:MAG: tetratricopeptide (TPR) repeat protein [Polyangiales bacterium]|jgi:tetratricopeptide (TPR) repeat protein
MRTSTQAFIKSRPRSRVVGVVGVVVALFGAFFVVAAVVELVGGTEDTVAPLLGGLFMSAPMFLGIWLVRRGFSPASPDFSDAKKIRETFLKGVTATDPQSDAINAAALLMMDKRYEESAAAYHAIADRFPSEKATAHSQIGVACFFVGRYEEAIQWYESALEQGADASTMHDNIAEAKGKLGF